MHYRFIQAFMVLLFSFSKERVMIMKMVRFRISGGYNDWKE